MKLVLAEKPSVAQSIAKVLGANKREVGYLEGNGYVVSWCVGHLVELAQLEAYNAKYSKWAYADLPIFPMDWRYEVSAGTKKQFGIEEYDELNIEVAFKNAVANSVSYKMYCRFVESPDNYFEHEDFQKVFDFNTRQTLNALGTAVNAISTRMFQEIEKAIGEHDQIQGGGRANP